MKQSGNLELTKDEVVKLILNCHGLHHARATDCFGIYDSVTVYYTTEPKEKEPTPIAPPSASAETSEDDKIPF